VSSVNAVVNEAAGSTSLARAMEVETRLVHNIHRSVNSESLNVQFFFLQKDSI